MGCHHCSRNPCPGSMHIQVDCTSRDVVMSSCQSRTSQLKHHEWYGGEFVWITRTTRPHGMLIERDVRTSPAARPSYRRAGRGEAVRVIKFFARFRELMYMYSSNFAPIKASSPRMAHFFTGQLTWTGGPEGGRAGWLAPLPVSSIGHVLPNRAALAQCG